MKLNIALLVIATLLMVNAETAPYDTKRLLRKGGSSSKSYSGSKSSGYSGSSGSKTYYKKTYTKTYTASRYSYTGAFYGGRSYAVLYVYYLPPAGYYQVGGYYSPLYNMIYYNGYGWNFYYNKGNYYADSPNAVYVSSGGGGIVGAIVGVIICCCIVACIWAAVTGKCGNTVVEEDDGEEV